MNVPPDPWDKGKVSRAGWGVLITRGHAGIGGVLRHGQAPWRAGREGAADSPARRRIKPGDVIVKFNGVEIDLSSDLPPSSAATEVREKNTGRESCAKGKSLKLTSRSASFPPEEKLSTPRGQADPPPTTGSRSPSRTSPIAAGGTGTTGHVRGRARPARPGARAGIRKVIS